VLRYLDAIEPSGTTDLARGVEELLARELRPGLVVVLSDFLDPAGFSRPLDRLIAARHEPVLFQILDREEIDPTPGGDLELVDAETGARTSVSLDARALRAYRARLAAFLDSLAADATKRGIFYGRVSSERPFEEVLIEYLMRGASAPGARAESPAAR
jgi:hypothetical protein